MTRFMSGTSTYQPNIAWLVGLTWLVIVGQMLWLDWPQTARVLGDTDDAMRLVEVRALLAGRGWFDLHEPRLQPPLGYDPHWSRLVDAGLAGLFLIFRTVADAAMAERLMRAIWPLLWLLPAIAGTAALAWRLGGRAATLVALLLLIFGLPAFFQFKPGRIDHHDIQITLAVLTLAAAIWADRAPWTATAAGALSGLALAIGFEAMPFIVLAGAVFAARYCLDPGAAGALVRYGRSAAASTALVFLVSVNPGHWTQSACDAIAINTVAPAVVGGLALSIAGHWFAHERVFARCAAILLALGLAAAVFVALEPRCLAGPLALVDPAVRPIWLAHVNEIQSLIAAARKNPSTAIGIVSFPMVAIFSIIALAQTRSARRDSGFVAAALALLLAFAMTIVAIRAAPYTIWLGVPFVAAGLLRLFERFKLRSLSARIAAILPFTPALISFGSVMMLEAIGPAQPSDSSRDAKACFEIENYAALARLPAGLVAADVDYGPFLLALTPHSVLGAPYHRLSYGIVASHRAFATPPEQAREILRHAQAAYVMTCGANAPKQQSDEEHRRSLWSELKSGNVPAWLEPIPGTGPFGVYRLKP